MPRAIEELFRQLLLSRVHKKPHSGIEPRCGFFSLVADVVDVTTGAVVFRATTFGVFLWLEVVDFDRFFVFLLFLCFVLHITFQLFVVCVMSVTPNN